MKRLLDATTAWLSKASSATADFCLHWLLFPFLFAVAGGAGVWALLNPQQLTALIVNKVPKDDRTWVIVFVGIAFFFLLLLYVGVVLIHRWRNAAWPGYASVSALHRWLSFLFVLPIIAVFMTRNIEHSDTLFVIFLIAAAAVACFPTFVEIVDGIDRIIEKRRHADTGISTRNNIAAAVWRYLPGIFVFAGFVAYSVHMSQVSINGLQALKTRSADMTIYANILFQSAHGNLLDCSVIRSGNHAAAHFDPILILFSPLYMLYPRPEFLSILQSVWFGLGMFPAFWLGKRILKSAFGGLVVAAAYALHPSLQLVNLFEFHSLALLGTPLLFAVYLLEARYYKRLFLLLPFILMIREDVALLMCFVGTSAVMSNREDAWVGTLVILISVAYFAVTKIFFMNSPDMFMSSKDTYNYTGFFSYMIPHRDGLGGLVASMISNPVYTLRQLISMQKFTFVMLLLGPLLMVPLFAKRWRFVLLYGVIFLLLASRGPMFSVRFHYQIVVFPVLIALLPLGIKRISETGWFGLEPPRMMAGLLGALLVSTSMSGSMFGALVKEKTRKQYTFEQTDNQKKQFKAFMKIREKLEPDASVLASSNIAPYIANRTKAYTFKHIRINEPIDYLFFDRKTTRAAKLKKYDEMIKMGIYKEIDRYEQITLYKYTPSKGREISPRVAPPRAPAPNPAAAVRAHVSKRSK